MNPFDLIYTDEGDKPIRVRCPSVTDLLDKLAVVSHCRFTFDEAKVRTWATQALRGDVLESHNFWVLCSGQGGVTTL